MSRTHISQATRRRRTHVRAQGGIGKRKTTVKSEYNDVGGVSSSGWHGGASLCTGSRKQRSNGYCKANGKAERPFSPPRPNQRSTGRRSERCYSTATRQREITTETCQKPRRQGSTRDVEGWVPASADVTCPLSPLSSSPKVRYAWNRLVLVSVLAQQKAMSLPVVLRAKVRLAALITGKQHDRWPVSRVAWVDRTKGSHETLQRRWVSSLCPTLLGNNKKKADKPHTRVPSAGSSAEP